MKFVLFNDYRPGLLQGENVVDLEAVVRPLGVQTGQEAMEAIITHIDDLRDQLSRLEREGEGVPLSTVALRPPLPRPDKVLCMGGNFREFGARQPSPMWGFLKSTVLACTSKPQQQGWITSIASSFWSGRENLAW